VVSGLSGELILSFMGAGGLLRMLIVVMRVMTAVIVVAVIEVAVGIVESVEA